MTAVDLASASAGGRARTTEDEFRRLLEQVGEGWSTGDPRLAADAYAENAVYIEPPNRQRYVGRRELYAFFHGPSSEPRPMRMIWHSIAFDAEGQVGFGEYTFARPGLQLHGIVTVTVADGKIASWREYQYRSDRPFEEFAGDSLRVETEARPSPSDTMPSSRRGSTSNPLKTQTRALTVSAHDGLSVWAFGGDHYTVRALSEDTSGRFGLIEAIIPAGSGPPRHLHRNEEEVFYLLAGQLEVTTDDVSEVIDPGAMVLIPRGVPHSFRNVSSHASRLLLWFLPGGFERLFLEVGVPGAEGPPPTDEYPAEVAKAVRVAVAKYGIEFV